MPDLPLQQNAKDNADPDLWSVAVYSLQLELSLTEAGFESWGHP